MEKYSYRIRKDDYLDKWYAEKLEWEVVVKRYDFPSAEEAAEEIEKWKEEE